MEARDTYQMPEAVEQNKGKDSGEVLTRSFQPDAAADPNTVVTESQFFGSALKEKPVSNENDQAILDVDGYDPLELSHVMEPIATSEEAAPEGGATAEDAAELAAAIGEAGINMDEADQTTAAANAASLLLFGGRLDQARKDKLEAIGFEWKVPDQMKNDQSWDQIFERLVEFRNINGHCNVPKKYPPDEALGRWVHSQRSVH